MARPNDQNVPSLSLVKGPTDQADNDEHDNVHHYQPDQFSVQPFHAPTVAQQHPSPTNTFAKTLDDLGATEESLLSSLLEIAQTGASRKIVRDGKGNTIQEIITEDGNLRLKAVEKLIELRNQPARRRIMYAEDVEY